MLEELARLPPSLVHLPVRGDQQRSGLRDDGDAGELFALEELERGAAAGREPRHVVRQAELLQCTRRIRAADDRERVRLSDGLGNGLRPDRKSTRLNSSHSQISYAVFCLKKKKLHR